MGKNNKGRRAAKARARAKGRARAAEGAPRWSPGAGTGRGSAWSPPPVDEPPIDDVTVARGCIYLAATGPDWRDEPGLGPLGVLASLPPGPVDRAAEELLVEAVSECWARGWRPVELERQGRLACPAAGARLIGVAIATDHAGRRSVTLDRRWLEQVESLGLPVVNGRAGWVRRWIDDERLHPVDALQLVTSAFGAVVGLPSLDEILPPPGSTRTSAGREPPRPADGPASAPMLERIRNLLAKAESTTFEVEADALTAKAQELMTRHAIDAALLEANGRSTDGEPAMTRVLIDAPYVDAKSLLLQTVAEAGRCRTVFLPTLAMSSLVGFPSDLASVEMLFTSLLVQAQTARVEAGRRTPAGTRTRSQSYRSAFLLSFATRIGDRLQEINQAVFADAEAELGSAFLPVLRSRSDAIDAFLDRRFGELARSRVRGGYDDAGWASGRVAADQAALNGGDLPSRESATR